MGEEDAVQARPVPLLSPRSDFHIPLLPRCEGLPRYELHGLLNLLSLLLLRVLSYFSSRLLFFHPMVLILNQVVFAAFCQLYVPLP